MAQVDEIFTIDSQLLEDFKFFCEHTGLTVSGAINIFAAQVVRLQKIPFAIEADPFYRPVNLRALEQDIKDIETGQAKMEEHELIEV